MPDGSYISQNCLPGDSQTLGRDTLIAPCTQPNARASHNVRHQSLSFVATTSNAL